MCISCHGRANFFFQQIKHALQLLGINAQLLRDAQMRAQLGVGFAQRGDGGNGNQLAVNVIQVVAGEQVAEQMRYNPAGIWAICSSVILVKSALASYCTSPFASRLRAWLAFAKRS